MLLCGENSRCFNCGSKDHFIAKCLKPRKNYRTTEISFIATAAFQKAEHISAVKFILDSGATQHVVNEDMNKYMFNIDNISSVKIKIANGTTMTTLIKRVF